MPDITNHPIDNGRIETEKELRQLIDEFLKTSDQTIYKENIANYVYFFFEPHGVDVGTTVFSTAAASVCFCHQQKNM